jgi:hypothetical protein
MRHNDEINTQAAPTQVQNDGRMMEEGRRNMIHVQFIQDVPTPIVQLAGHSEECQD